MSYCRNNESDALSFFMKKMYSLQENTFESQFTSFMFGGFAGSKYLDLMDEVKQEWKDQNYTSEGAYIAPNDIANTKNLIKK